MSGQIGNVGGVSDKTVKKILNSEQVKEIKSNYINMEHARKNSTIETEVEKEKVTREQAEENKKTQQSHAKANNARLEEISNMKEAAQKTAVKNVAKDIANEAVKGGALGGAAGAKASKSPDLTGSEGTKSSDSYEGTVEVSGQVGYSGIVGYEYVQAYSKIGYTPKIIREEVPVPYAGTTEVIEEKSDMENILYEVKLANDATIKHFDDLNNIQKSNEFEKTYDSKGNLLYKFTDSSTGEVKIVDYRASDYIYDDNGNVLYDKIKTKFD